MRGKSLALGSQLGETRREKIEEEPIHIDAEPVDAFLRTRLQKFASIRDLLALVLVLTFCLSVILFFVLSCLLPSRAAVMSESFEKVLFVLSPLVALVVGTYHNRWAGERMDR